MYAIGRTCRVVLHDDPRPELRRDGVAYVFAALHAHVVGSAITGDENIGALVSRSGDGEMIVPTLRLHGITPIRGSSGRRKGGSRAVGELVRHVRGGNSAFVAVDGPHGPRGKVRGGVGLLARRGNAPVLPVVVVPRRRWVLAKAWDRMQIPKPLTRLDVYFAAPMWVAEGEPLDAFAARVSEALHELERRHDPDEASHSRLGRRHPAVTAPRAAPRGSSTSNSAESTRSPATRIPSPAG